MNPHPIVFGLANPNPEIAYDVAMEARPDVIMATGRVITSIRSTMYWASLIFSGGALDVRATDINEEMKVAAVKAITNLAKEPVPMEVNVAYSHGNLTFGAEYFVPKPTDPRLLETIAPAVAEAAMESGGVAEPSETRKLMWRIWRKRLGIGHPLLRKLKANAEKHRRESSSQKPIIIKC